MCTKITTRDVECAIHKWIPSKNDDDSTSSNVRGIVIIYHGFAAHARYPTVEYVAQLAVQHDFLVYAMDMPGHGKSPGTRGLLPSAEDVVEDCVSVVTYAKENALSSCEKKQDLPLFLVGSSMGGALALRVSKQLPSSDVTGVIMLAPMLSLKVSSLEQTALKSLAWIAPTLAVIPSSATNSEKQYRDPERRAEADADTLTYKGKLRCQSAHTCVELAQSMKKVFGEVTVPFLCMIANEDVVVDNSVAEDLMSASPSSDKTLKKYDALHGLLCEPRPLRDEIESDIIQWMEERCAK